MSSYLDYIKERKTSKENYSLLKESFSTKDIKNALNLMLEIFKKKIDGMTIFLGEYNTKVNGESCITEMYLNLHNGEFNLMWGLNFLVSSKSAEVYSIDFFERTAADNILWFDNKKAATTELSIYTLGSSVAYFVPIICHIVNNKDFSLGKDEAVKLGNTVFESYDYYYGAQKYAVQDITFAEIAKQFVDNVFEAKNEATEERKRIVKEIEKAKASGDTEAAKRFRKEYAEITQAIKGGATTLNELKMALKKDVKVDVVSDDQTKEAEEEYEAKIKDPKQAFKEMSVYINTVIKGLQPGAIICGAPGVGKTYKIMQQLKAAGYVDEHNMCVIKGKCSVRQLYLTLYDYKSKGKIIVIDDADALVGPKAPEDCINILKAALDSTAAPEGRKVSYKIAGRLMDDDGNDVPKTCYVNCGIIIITNYGIGQLDTAIRGRVFTQSLSFTTEQLLSIIKDLIPSIEPTKLSLESKIKAYKYLERLSKETTEMEISIRSFGTCARLFMVCENDNDFTDEDVESMIREQMENQYKKTDRHF